MANPLGPVPGYSVVTSGDFTEQYTEAYGAMVIGRDANLTGFGVGKVLLPDPARVDLAVGRNLTAIDGQVANGSVTYGVSQNVVRMGVPHGTITKAAPPFDVPALFDGLLIRSTSWATLSTNTTSSFDGDKLMLVGTAARNVFNLSAATLQKARALYLKVPDGATTLINMPDGSFQNTLEGGIFIWDEATGYVQVG